MFIPTIEEWGNLGKEKNMNKLFTKIATLSVGLAMAVGVGVAVGNNANFVKAEAVEEEITYALTGNWTTDNGDWSQVSNTTNLSALASGKWGINSGTAAAISPQSYLNISKVVFKGTKSTSGTAKINLYYSATNLESGSWTRIGDADRSWNNTLTWNIANPVTGYLKFSMQRTAGNIYIASLAVTYSLPNLDSIAVSETSAPEKHFEGDVINSSDLTITPTYGGVIGTPITDGTGVYFNSTYTQTAYELSEGDNAVPVYFKDNKNRTANTTLNINGVEAGRTVVDVLSIASAPTKVVKNGSINNSEVTLNVSYNEGPNGVVIASNVSCTTTTGGVVEATATYSSATGVKTAKWNVTVCDGSQSYPYTFDMGYAIIDALEADVSGGNAYIEGVISKITYNYANNQVSFNFSADGSQSGNQINAFKCVATSANDYIVGDKVIMYGELLNYNGTKPELNEGCTVFKRNTPTSLSISGATTVYTVGDEFEFDGTAKLVWSIDGIDSEALNNSDLSFSKTQGQAFTKSEQGAQSITVTYSHSRFGNINGTLSVTVNWAAATGVSLDVGNEKTIILDDDITITATVLDADLAEQKVAWSYTTSLVENTDYEVLEDDNCVVLYSKKTAGVVRVTATAGSYSAYCDVTITDEPTVRLDESSLTAWTGDTSSILTATYENFGSNTPTLTWVSSNEAVATVTKDSTEQCMAEVEYVGAGSATITVTATYGDKHPTDICSVTVSQSAITGITLSNSEENIYTNDPFTLTVTGYTKAGGNETEGVTWETSDGTIATVSNGVVTGLKEGDVTITARSTYSTSVTASCDFHITQDEMTLTWGSKGTLRYFVGDKIVLNEGATLTAKYLNPGKADVELTLGTSGVGAYLKDSDGKNKASVNLNTYTYLKTDNGRKLGFTYTDGTLSAETSGYTLTIVNWRNVYVTTANTGAYDFTSIANTSGTVLSESQINSCWSSSDNVSAPSVSGITKLYGTGSLLQFGSSGNAGSFKLTFSEDVESITISYTADKASKITITNCTDIVINDSTSPVSRTLSSAENEITIGTDNRLKITAISINFAEAEKNVGKSDDALAVQAFVDGYMHMEDYDPELHVGVAGDGDCKGNGKDYYGKNTETGAKHAFNQLTLAQRKMLTSNSAFANEWARLQAWAIANGDSLNASNQLAQASSALTFKIQSESNVTTFIIVVAVISTLCVGGFFFIRKKKNVK